MTDLVNLKIKLTTESDAMELHLDLIDIPYSMNQEMFLSLGRTVEKAMDLSIQMTSTLSMIDTLHVESMQARALTAMKDKKNRLLTRYVPLH